MRRQRRTISFGGLGYAGGRYIEMHMPIIGFYNPW
jgi:hypothetical protein